MEEKNDFLHFKQDLATQFDRVFSKNLSSRRECKSTSDESFNNDFKNNLNLNEGAFGSICTLISPPTGSLGKLKISRERRMKRLQSTNQIVNENIKIGSLFTKNRLIQAVSQNDFNATLNLLKTSSIDINSKDDKQRTCLHIASSRGNIDIVKLLLDYGANPNIRDCVSNLPIHLAIISSHVAIVTLLLEAGTDLNTLDCSGNTVLHLAGTRLRWLLNDENKKANPKLKLEAIQIMNMIKEYLKRKKELPDDFEALTNKFENILSFDEFNNVTNEILNKFNSFNLN